MFNKAFTAVATTLLATAASTTSSAADLECPIENVADIHMGVSTVVENVAYIAGHQFSTVDVSDPFNPVVLGSTSLPGAFASKVDVSGGIAVTVHPGHSQFVNIVDVSDPTTPAVVSTIESSGFVGAAVQGNWAYVTSSGDSVLRVYDLTDSGTPVLVAEVDVFLPFDVAVEGDFAFTVGSVPMTAWDVSNPANPQLIGTADTFNGGHAVVDGDRLLVRHIWCGGLGCGGVVHVVDVSDPQSPILLGTTGPVSAPGHFAVMGDAILFPSSPLNFDGGLYVFDVSDPGDITASVVNIGHTYAAAAHGSIALVHSEGGLLSIDMTDCLEPPCAPADLNCDGVVDVTDLLILLGAWGDCPGSGECPADLNGDGTVGVSDLFILLTNWG